MSHVRKYEHVRQQTNSRSPERRTDFFLNRIYCYLRLHLLAIQSGTIIVIAYYLNKCIDDVCTRAMVRRRCVWIWSIDSGHIVWQVKEATPTTSSNRFDTLTRIRNKRPHRTHSIRLHYKSDADFRISLLANSTDCAFDAVCNVFCWRFFFFSIWFLPTLQPFRLQSGVLKRFDATMQSRRRRFVKRNRRMAVALKAFAWLFRQMWNWFTLMKIENEIELMKRTFNMVLGKSVGVGFERKGV